MGGRTEVSIIFYRPVTRRDLIFEARKVVFLWECLIIFATGCSFSLPEWQAVKMIFFAPCLIRIILLLLNVMLNECL